LVIPTKPVADGQDTRPAAIALAAQDHATMDAARTADIPVNFTQRMGKTYWKANPKAIPKLGLHCRLVLVDFGFGTAGGKFFAPAGERP
jgi:hypothetical protein